MAPDVWDGRVRPPLAAYRTLTLNIDGQVLASAPLQAADDVQAQTLARAMASDHAVELWDGLRFIEHFNAENALA